MNKTLRNKVLKDANRLIVANMNGENWACPDGHFAVAHNIYEGYRVKKDQTDWTDKQKPLLHEVLKSNSDYALAEFVEVSENDANHTFISSTASPEAYMVNSDYWGLLKNIYPEALPFIATDGYKFAPVELQLNGVLVAVLMPLRK
jgi:hypothetical protein